MVPAGHFKHGVAGQYHVYITVFTQDIGTSHWGYIHITVLDHTCSTASWFMSLYWIMTVVIVKWLASTMFTSLYLVMTVVPARDFTAEIHSWYYIHITICGHEGGTSWSFEM